MRKVQLELTDQLYHEATRRAVDAGFATVDDFAADVLTSELTQERENFDHFFTPARISHLNEVVESVRAGGKTFSPAEVQANLEIKRAHWIEKNGS